MAYNKVVYGGNTLIDLTSDTVDASHLLQGYTAHAKNGEKITGTYVGGGGSSNLATGTVTLTTSSSSTNIKITDTSEIGFTPKAFFLWCDTAQTSRYYITDSFFCTLGSGGSYIRHTKYRGSSADAYLNATTNWTSQTSGYLYFTSDTVYFRNTSSYRVASAQYRWVAVTW